MAPPKQMGKAKWSAKKATETVNSGLNKLKSPSSLDNKNKTVMNHDHGHGAPTPPPGYGVRESRRKPGRFYFYKLSDPKQVQWCTTKGSIIATTSSKSNATTNNKTKTRAATGKLEQTSLPDETSSTTTSKAATIRNSSTTSTIKKSKPESGAKSAALKEPHLVNDRRGAKTKTAEKAPASDSELNIWSIIDSEISGDDNHHEVAPAPRRAVAHCKSLRARPIGVAYVKKLTTISGPWGGAAAEDEETTDVEMDSSGDQMMVDSPAVASTSSASHDTETDCPTAVEPMEVDQILFSFRLEHPVSSFAERANQFYAEKKPDAERVLANDRVVLYFVFDTNVFLQDIEVFDQVMVVPATELPKGFNDVCVVVPWVVTCELDRFKQWHGGNNKHHMAKLSAMHWRSRDAERRLLRWTHSGTPRLQQQTPMEDSAPMHRLENKTGSGITGDDRVLKCAMQWHANVELLNESQNHDVRVNGSAVMLLTNDNNLLLKAEAAGVACSTSSDMKKCMANWKLESQESQ